MHKGFLWAFHKVRNEKIFSSSKVIYTLRVLWESQKSLKTMLNTCSVSRIIFHKRLAADLVRNGVKSIDTSSLHQSLWKQRIWFISQGIHMTLNSKILNSSRGIQVFWEEPIFHPNLMYSPFGGQSNYF